MKEYLDTFQTDEAIIERQVSKNVRMVKIAKFTWTYYVLKGIPVKYVSPRTKISHFLWEKHGLNGRKLKRWSDEKATSISNHPSLTEKKADDIASAYVQALA